MKIMIIGCTHAGTAAILNSRRLHPEAQITVYEKNDNISFLSCGIALYIGGIIKDPQGLFYSSPEELKKLSIDTKMQHEITRIDVNTKTATVLNLKTGKEFEDTYDKLIITAGSWPIVPEIEGIDLANIQLCKNYDHSKILVEKTKEAKRVAIVGAGYIGVELAEAFRMQGKEVAIIDMEPRMMAKYLDKEFTDIAERSFMDNGIRLVLGQKVAKFEGENGKVSKIITDKDEIDADLVVMCIGFRPNTDVFREQLDMMKCGAIITDEYMRTSHPDVMAAGDCASIMFNPNRTVSYIPLATNAIRMGTLAAINMEENKVRHPGTQGTSGIKIYGYCFASTGLTVHGATESGILAKSITIEENYRPEFMPTTEKVTLKVIYDADSKRLLGAALLSKADVTLAINILSLAIQEGMLVTDLAMADFFFQPHFNKPWSFINLAGLKALEEKP